MRLSFSTNLSVTKFITDAAECLSNASALDSTQAAMSPAGHDNLLTLLERDDCDAHDENPGVAKSRDRQQQQQRQKEQAAAAAAGAWIMENVCNSDR